MRYIKIDGKKVDYDDWKVPAGFGMPKDKEELKLCKYYRWPLEKELAEERKAHIQKLKDQGAPNSWIAKLYGLSKTHIAHILKN